MSTFASEQNDRLSVPKIGQQNGKLYEYVLSHTRESELLRRIRIETEQNYGNKVIMHITPEQAQFLAMIVKITKAKKGIEMGVFTGYSSVAIATALPSDGQLIAIDNNEEYMSHAEEYWKEAGVSSKITKQIGEGQEMLDRILSENGEDNFDFAFLDADKSRYDTYYEQLLKLVKVGGMIIIDNVLMQGRVLDPEPNDPDTQAILKLNRKIHFDKRIDLSIVPIGDGMALCRKL